MFTPIKHYKISKFNKKWADKELMFCSRIYNDIFFALTKVRVCCHSTSSPYAPPILYMGNIKKLNYDKYIHHIDRIMTINQTSKSVCAGCKYFSKQKVPKLDKSGNINFFTINHFSKCNANCVYCSDANKNDEISYYMFPIIKRFVNEGLISKDCIFNWGGGEPVICEEFEEISSFLKSHKFNQVINSSGIEFSEIILDGLKNNIMSIQISPDSGTSDTYFKVKRQKTFEQVWQNIKKYSQYPDNLYVKYIIFSMNSSENDIREFVRLCKENNVKNIVIDTESNSSNGDGEKFGRLSCKEIDAAILLKNLALENGLNYTTSYQWNDHNRNLIENS